MFGDLFTGLMLVIVCVIFGSHIIRVGLKALANDDMESVRRCVVAGVIALFIFAGAFRAYAWAIQTKMKGASSQIFATNTNPTNNWDNEK